MRKIFIILTFIECLSSINGWSQQNSKITDSIPTIYEYYKNAFDKGDTVKLKAKTSGYCRHKNLTQIIKKNDSTLIVHNITTPCLDGNKDNTSPSTHTGTTNLTMPPIEDFDYSPYLIEIPMEAYNYWDFNLINATGKITIIDIRRNLTTKELLKYTPYSEYDMNFIEFIEFAQKTNKEYGIYDYLINKNGNDYYKNIDLFSDKFRNTFGPNPTFYLNHMWGVHITENFIVLLENIQNGLIIDDNKEEDYTEIFIRMAESIRPLNPSIFNLKELENYK